MRRTIPFWKQDLLNQIETMSNDILFENMIEAQVPDDYDGCFTHRGAEEANIYLKAVKDRLKLAGWLTKEA
jgi:hypothetical protein